MLEAIDKYKFGILAAFATYIGIFMYTNMQTYTTYFEIEPFNESAYIAPEEEFQLTPENIQVPPNYDQEVLNIGRNMHDDRERSSEEYYENQSPEQIAADVRALEQQMRNEAGGSEERQRLQERIDQRKRDQELAAQNQSQNGTTPTEGGDTQADGYTMVNWDLGGRDAFQKNKWHVRNPGYKCYNANGTIVIHVKVNANGDVTSAVYSESESSGVTSCMITEALKYAKKSRFEYSSGSKGSSGKIFYTFVSKR
jgi:hypothetical protein